MSHHPFPPDPCRPVPQASVDRIADPRDALAVIALAAALPLEHETILFGVDHLGCGSVITSVTGTHRPDDVITVVELFAAAMAQSGSEPTGLVVASVRPEGTFVAGDTERWMRIERIADSHGITLHEWFVIGPEGATCPRELTGRPASWPDAVCRRPLGAPRDSTGDRPRAGA